MMPGAVLGTVFIAVGMEVGFGFPMIFHSGRERTVQLACLALFCICAWYVRRIWRDGAHLDPVSRISAVSPRLQAVIFGACLGVGLVVGVFAGCAGPRFV